VIVELMVVAVRIRITHVTGKSFPQRNRVQTNEAVSLFTAPVKNTPRSVSSFFFSVKRDPFLFLDPHEVGATFWKFVSMFVGRSA
jgi:hypothetical protein